MKRLEKLVIASHNEGKVREIRELVTPLNIHVLSAGEAGVSEPEETGTTFAANAELKARNAARESGLPSLADDSGLVIPAINGAPGIYSARWAGPKKDFDLAFARIQKELATIPSPARGGGSGRGKPLGHSNQLTPSEKINAYFISALCLCFPPPAPPASGGSVEGNIHHFEGRIDGTLTFPARGEKGFGYDPIFIPEGKNLTFAQMPLQEKQHISHRARAFAKFVEFLNAQDYNPASNH